MPFSIALVALVLAKRWLSQHIYGLGLLISGKDRGASCVLFWVLLPGILLHELSHWLAAKILGVRVGRLSLGPQRSGERLRLGSVHVASSDPLRGSFIGVAPLFVGSLFVLLVTRVLLVAPLKLSQEALSDLGGWLGILRLGVGLYLLFSISNAMLPSEADRRRWRPVVLFLVLATSLSLLRVIPQLPPSVVSAVFWGLRVLTIAFLLALASDLLIMVLVYPLEWIVGHLRGRRVEYR